MTTHPTKLSHAHNAASLAQRRDALLAEWKKLAGQDARFDQLAANTERLIAAATAQAEDFLYGKDKGKRA